MVARRSQDGMDASRSALAVSRLPRAAHEPTPTAPARLLEQRHEPASPSVLGFIHCGTASPPICWSKRPISGSSKSCLKQRHTARQHPIEARIYYPFHPRYGETVFIVRQYAYRGAELVVIPQPDGSVACIPAWMTHESAAHHQLCAERRLPLDILRSLRVEIDALLGFLQSHSGMENANNETQGRKPSAG